MIKLICKCNGRGTLLELIGARVARDCPVERLRNRVLQVDIHTC
jgi:hypothetical protein